MLSSILAVEPPKLTYFYDIIFWLMVVVLAITMIVAIIDVFLQRFLKKQGEKRLSARSEIKKRLLLASERQHPLAISDLKKLNINNVVPAIYDFEKESVRGEEWTALQEKIEREYLLPIARHLASSRRWTKRLKAIRCLALAKNRSQDEAIIIALLRDKIPIIRFTAAQLAGEMATPQSIDAILAEMQLATHYMRHIYHEAIKKGGEKAYALVEGKLEHEKNSYMRVSCLEILRDRMNEHVLELLQGDLHAEQKNLKIAAIRAASYFPHPKSAELLLPLLSDPEWEVRATSARALGYLKAENAVEPLGTLCADRHWWVRFNAALALRRIGEAGVNKLKSLPADGDRFAYDMAQYALAFDNPMSCGHIYKEHR